MFLHPVAVLRAILALWPVTRLMLNHEGVPEMVPLVCVKMGISQNCIPFESNTWWYSNGFAGALCPNPQAKHLHRTNWCGETLAFGRKITCQGVDCQSKQLQTWFCELLLLLWSIMNLLYPPGTFFCRPHITSHDIASQFHRLRRFLSIKSACQSVNITILFVGQHSPRILRSKTGVYPWHLICTKGLIIIFLENHHV